MEDKDTCSNCMFYKIMTSKSQVGIEKGKCKRNPPTHDGFPAVFPDNWCGEHKRNNLLLG